GRCRFGLVSRRAAASDEARRAATRSGVPRSDGEESPAARQRLALALGDAVTDRRHATAQRIQRAVALGLGRPFAQARVECLETAAGAAIDSVRPLELAEHLERGVADRGLVLRRHPKQAAYPI